MSSTDREGRMDASPRGGLPGFVHVLMKFGKFTVIIKCSVKRVKFR